jgi:hypothetical protein
MKFGLEPVGHVSPLPRIDLGPKWRRDEPATDLLDKLGQVALENINRRRHDRIMELVRNAAEATNISNGGRDDALA